MEVSPFSTAVSTASQRWQHHSSQSNKDSIQANIFLLQPTIHLRTRDNLLESHRLHAVRLLQSLF